MVSTLRPDLSETLQRVLAEPRFPTPAESWWDRFVARLLSEAARLFAALIDAIGGPAVAAVIALLLVAVIVLFVVFRLAGRRASDVEARQTLARMIERGVDPDEMLRQAAAASRNGDHRNAVRYRFVAGVLDMARRGRIRYEPGLTTEGIARQVTDPTFDDLADQFDAIVYGGREASVTDDEVSQRMWDQLRSRS